MSTFDAMREYIAETARYESIMAMVEWDQQTYLPTKANDYRAEQITLLSGLIHRRNTDPQLGEWLSELSEQNYDDVRVSATVRNAKRDYDKATKLPADLVEALARCTAKAHQVWNEARTADDYSIFQPMLQEVISLKQQQADAIGFDECRYDALLDDYEPEIKTSEIRPLLEGLRQELVPLVQTIMDSGKSAPVELLTRNFPISAQSKFGRQAAAAIGFDFDSGRLDVAHHPFCTELGPRDCQRTID